MEVRKTISFFFFVALASSRRPFPPCALAIEDDEITDAVTTTQTAKMKESKHSSRLKYTRTFMLVICGLIALLCSSVQCFSQSTMLTYVAPPSVRRYVATQSRLASPLVRVSLWSNEDNEPSVEDYFIRRAVLAGM